MTEDEAKQKWCPFVQAVGEFGSYTNRGDFKKTCLASGCMAWRWNELKGNTTDEEDGYCGLAGKE